MVVAAARVAVALALCAATTVSHASAAHDRVRSVVDGAVKPVMEKYRIPGMAVGIIADGQTHFLNYGVASTQTGKPVTTDTLFELGSISKTFTATLAAYAQIGGYLSLSEPAGKFLSGLRGCKFGDVTLLDLGTHTAGGLPLQVPDDVRNDQQLMTYLQRWRPAYPPGTMRTYSNIGIGMLGVITAKSMGEPFDALVEHDLFSPLGMTSSYFNVPQIVMTDYAQGYTSEGAPIRMAPGVLSTQAYGVKSTAPDMLRFLEANMDMLPLDAKLQHAITDTHTGYFTAGVLTQDLIWEQYRYPPELATLREGNSPSMIYNSNAATKITPAQEPRPDVWIDKTGTTNGFAAYVAFVPERQLGIVMLANKSIPIDARVMAAYAILTSLDR
ncbi:MAG: beta-lactamase [Candidatus Eremiobacteraeota bacterium]|nr:beta-lactamase [Candidatus Eremiobacteraeota bacterium]